MMETTIPTKTPTMKGVHTPDHNPLMWLNLGPSHPATHGTLRIFVGIEGEVIQEMKYQQD